MFSPQSEDHFHHLWKGTSFVIALLMLFIAVVIGIILNDLRDLTLMENLVLFAFLGILYLVFLSVLFEFTIFNRTKIVETEVIREVEKPVIQEVIKEVDRPIVQKVVVEKPVYHSVPEYIYIDRKKNLDIPKYDYLGSSESMTYHKRSCRFSKLIKKRYKVVNNDVRYFIKNKYRPCKQCIKK